MPLQQPTGLCRPGGETPVSSREVLFGDHESPYRRPVRPPRLLQTGAVHTFGTGGGEDGEECRGVRRRGEECREAGRSAEKWKESGEVRRSLEEWKRGGKKEEEGGGGRRRAEGGLGVRA